MDKYIQERVADAVERAVATIEGRVEALQSRVDQLETALKQKESVTPRRQKVDKEVSVSTYFRHCNYIKLVSVKLSRKIFICCNVSPFLVVNICDTTDKKKKYMSYKIKIQCLAIIYHFFSPDYSSVVDNHSVIHIITVILSSTFIAAHTEHI